jgi:hypothetical protein
MNSLEEEQMKKYVKQFLPIAMIFLFATNFVVIASGATHATVDRDGKSWLGAHTEPAKINVTGTWNAPEWGDIVLNQDANGQLTGHGDEWHVHGVVSGNRVFLLFSSFSEIHFSAILTAAGDNVLDGGSSIRSYVRRCKRESDAPDAECRAEHPSVAGAADGEDCALS